jgi:hypothetical protein
MAVGVGDTIQDVLRRLYPKRSGRSLLIAPLNPADVFAGAAYLLQVSGAYHHVQPDGDGHPEPSPRILYVTKDMRGEVSAVAAEWSLSAPPFKVPDKVQELWVQLWNFGDSDLHGAKAEVFVQLSPKDNCPDWWIVALKLMLIADEAVADRVGWVPIEELADGWLPVQEIMADETEGDVLAKQGKLSTIALQTNQDIVNVLPKARTPSVGCTLRSLSHHLALLPPRGVARAYWVSPYDKVLKSLTSLNILIVPFPYSVSARSFRSKTPEDVVVDRNWGWFDLDSVWVNKLGDDDFVGFLKKLIAKAEADCSQVHGIVLPELALNWDQYARIIVALKNVAHLEFVISGICSTENGERKGNFVAMTMFGRLPPGNNQTRLFTTRVREKHHRWKLEDHQIGGYALSSALSPNAHWWEKLDIMSRAIDVFVFRKDSCLTTLICEDLARVDPCQELVRSIGPNLVVALLMDSAQIKSRWPARYATVLAEDPGSSVLTVTSRALVDRFNAEGGAEHRSNAIALWRDDGGTLRTIDLPDDNDAVVLTLAGHKHDARTLDGRVAKNSQSWRYHGQQPIRADITVALRNKIRER